jgi:hypothetical protein
MSTPESIPEDRQESYECDCGGSRVQVGDHWECDKCDWASAPPPDQSDEDRREKDETRAGVRPFELRGPTNH